MKVLMICGCEIDKTNPIRNFDFDQSIALKKCGVDVKIVGIDIRTILHTKKITTIHKTIDGIEIVCSSLLVKAIPHGLKEEICKMHMSHLFIKYFKDWNPDIIHAQWGPNSYYISKVVQTYKIPMVVTEHCSKMNRENPDKVYAKFAKLGYSCAKKRICVGKKLQENLIKITGYKFDVLENVLDPLVFTNDFSYTPRPVNDKVRIISAGHYIKSKNFIQLFEALSLITDIDYQLDVYGNGEEKKKMIQSVHNLNLDNKVYIHDRLSRSELVNEYLRSDLFVLLSLSETFGVVFIEAMACGLPVVSLDCGGTSDIITSDEYGIIIRENSTEDISKKLCSTLYNISDYNRQGISKHALESYRYDVFANKLIRIYEEILMEIKI